MREASPDVGYLSADTILRDLSAKENLSIADALQGIARCALIQAIKGDLPPRAFGDIFAGGAKLAEAGGGGGIDDDLRAYLGITSATTVE